MTLIVGIKCQDGLVVGADGAATYGMPFGPSTIRQATKKIEVIGSQIILAVSGPIGVAQSFRDEIGALAGSSGISPWRTVPDAKRQLKDKLWGPAGEAWKRAEVVAKTTGAMPAVQSANTHSVVAFPLQGGNTAHLVQFDPQCNPEEVTANLPFVSAGSGQAMADPFLAFLRRVLWPDALPTVQDGVFAALWTLDYAIKATPGGVTEPIQIVTLVQEPNKVWIARQVPFDEHRQALTEVEEQIAATIRRTFDVAHTTPIPAKMGK